MVTFDSDTEEFLAALKEGSSETYRPGRHSSSNSL
jgi:hypothetical protein